MSWCWLARRAQRPDDAIAGCALTHANGVAAGLLAAWPGAAPEPYGAVKVDSRCVDPGGGPAWVTLVWPPAAGGVLFDDPAVCGAIRATLLMPPPDFVSTFSRGDGEFAGAVTGVYGPDTDRLSYDPFAAVFPRELLRAGPGLWGRTPMPVGPGTQRYGPNNPWPWDSFS